MPLLLLLLLLLLLPPPAACRLLPADWRRSEEACRPDKKDRGSTGDRTGREKVKQRTKRITQTKQTKQTSSGRKQDSRNCGARKNVAPTRKCREKARVRLLLHGYWFMYRFARGFGNRKKRNRDRSKRQRQSIVKKRKLGRAQAMLRPDARPVQGLRCSQLCLGPIEEKYAIQSANRTVSGGVGGEKRGFALRVPTT